MLLYLAAFSTGLLSTGAIFFFSQKYRNRIGIKLAQFWSSLFLLILLSFINTYLAAVFGDENDRIGFYFFLLTNGSTVFSLLLAARLNGALADRQIGFTERLVLAGLIGLYILVIIQLSFSRQSLEWKNRLFVISSFPFLSAFLLYILLIMINTGKKTAHTSSYFRVAGVITILYILIDLISPYAGAIPSLYSFPTVYLFWSIFLLAASFRYEKEISRKPVHLGISSTFAERFRITPREKEVAEHLIAGKTKQAIADELFISYKTVDKHVSNIYEKTEVHSKIELISLINSSG